MVAMFKKMLQEQRAMVWARARAIVHLIVEHKGQTHFALLMRLQSGKAPCRKFVRAEDFIVQSSCDRWATTPYSRAPRR